MDDQYYQGDEDRVKLSKLSDMAKNEILLDRFKMIKRQCENIEFSYALQQEAK